MPAQLDIDKMIADNPNVDVQELRKGEEALTNLQRSGAVRRSSYGLDTPESKRDIRPTRERDFPDCLSAFRKLKLR